MDGWGATDSGWGDSGGFGSSSAATSDKPRSRDCFNCGEPGHNKMDCPNPPKAKKGCFKCGKEGHNKADCPEAGDGGGDAMKCHKCDKEGHMARDCDKPDVCRKCNEEGHMARECEKPDICRRCNQEGHMVRDCPEPEQTRTVEKEDGTKVEIYVPSEVSEDKLFEQGIASGINFDKYDNIQVKCSGENVPRPLKSFEDANLRTILTENIKKSGYARPTPVQKHAMPCIAQKRDLMACAQTGSGKTAAFLLPILHRLLEDGCPNNSGDCPQKPQAVVVAPTRELAIQIKDEARKFSSGSIIKSVVAYGGTSSGAQMSQLFKGCNLLIATPGRLMDFVDKGKISFEDVKYLVLDEADRMLDMGFHPEVTRIVNSGGMPSKGDRQTLMFSATFPDTVQGLAIDLLKDYLFLAVGIVGAACDDVTQTFHQVEKFGKRDKLVEILKEVGTDRTMVFVETKKNADFIATFLSGEGFPTTSIHGDRLQREREEALSDFKAGRMPIIVATGVASRGIDIKGVAHVINYDLPKEVDEYVHRIGRTGRVGNIGKATSFFDPTRSEDTNIAGRLVNILAQAQQEVPSFLSDAGSGGGGSGGNQGFGGQDIRGGASSTNAGGDDEGW